MNILVNLKSSDDGRVGNITAETVINNGKQTIRKQYAVTQGMIAYHKNPKNFTMVQIHSVIGQLLEELLRGRSISELFR
jgi:hypothetical protein